MASAVPIGSAYVTARELAAAIRLERDAREAQVKRTADALAEQLETEVQELHRRIDEVHKRALRELTRLHGGGIEP